MNDNERDQRQQALSVLKQNEMFYLANDSLNPELRNVMITTFFLMRNALDLKPCLLHI